MKDRIEEHLSDIRKLAIRQDLTPDERESIVRAERFAISLLREHNEFGHDGKRCPFATLLA